MAAFIKLASQNKTRLGTNMRLRDREMVQSVVGRAEAIHGAARAFLVEAMAELSSALDDDSERFLHARARLRIACAHAAEGSLGIVHMLATEAGAVAIFESCPLERFVRDMHAAVKHVAMNPFSYVVAGRLSLGLDPGVTRL